MKKKILAGLLLAGGTMFAAPRVSFGIGFGVPAPVVVAPPVVAAVPRAPVLATCSSMDTGSSAALADPFGAVMIACRRISTVMTRIFAAKRG